ncbi:hypothetical protein TGAM01_v203427 [Trichoderma gamsii]|uniref:Uncharacterized protein n=1 Tax=Trichoderma gamsii TaxID=398673 RepID=A0A2P4ZTP4_9HYPO|nr:hypothetical protein TGAM01_v203427 [Trichoderma gamsii]PON27660.1 hypothetical protein TGAM01_v203427 [Trichoderma gamsii]
MVPIVYIHGKYAGCNHAVAKELCKLIPNSKLIDDSLNVGPAKAAARSAEEYWSFRTALRRRNLRSIYSEESASETTWIIVDQDYSQESKSFLAADYEFAAVSSHSPVISIIINYDLELSCKKAREDAKDSVANNAKADELEKIRDRCNKEQVFRFRNDYELEFEVTLMSPTMAAETVRAHIQTVKRRLEKKEKHAWIRAY